jgi:hypothetical protein
MGHVVEGLTDLFGVMGQTQQILEEAAREADAAHHMLVGIIRTIVEWVAGNLVLDAAVLGTATAFEAAGTAAFLAEKAAEAHATASAIAQVYLALHGAVAALETAKATFDSAQGLGALIQFANLGTTFGHTFAIGKISELGSPLVEQALGLEWATGFAARTVIGRLAMAGVGPVGLVRKAGITVAKDVVVPVVKDLAEGKPGEVAKVLRQEAAVTGLVAPELPHAQPAETISGLLDGTSSGLDGPLDGYHRGVAALRDGLGDLDPHPRELVLGDQLAGDALGGGLDELELALGDDSPDRLRDGRVVDGVRDVVGGGGFGHVGRHVNIEHERLLDLAFPVQDADDRVDAQVDDGYRVRHGNEVIRAHQCPGRVSIET